jgi:tRNA (guanosine-2'-O-)-methyltransferase
MLDDKYIEYLEQFVSEKRRILFQKVLNERTRHFTVAIEDIYQPHNSSAVVRSCDIFGIQDIHIIENKYKFYASNRVAKGAQKWLNFSVHNKRGVNNTANCIADLRSRGYQIIATTPHNNSCMLSDFDIGKRSAFFFGVEKEGLSNEVLDNADGFLKIPMMGFTESLNISVAASIILQRLTENLRRSDVNWALTYQEKKELYLEWMQKSIKSIDKIKSRYYSEIANR